MPACPWMKRKITEEQTDGISGAAAEEKIDLCFCLQSDKHESDDQTLRGNRIRALKGSP